MGAIDWNIRNFHGYRTGRGTTYGAYLIIDDKVTLIDTVKEEFAGELLSRIRSILPPERIDIIISNHVEMDHSGALPVLRNACPHAVIYTAGTAGQKGLTAHYGAGEYHTVKSGDCLSLGKRTLTFLATPMLHWPDNMVTYCPEEKILFSNDAFGQHLASSQRFDDEIPLSTVLEEAKRYYGNILMCYNSQAKRAWELISKLDISLIAPSHGIIWRSHISEILDAYAVWSSNAPKDGALVIYDSMWHSTEKIARVICEAFGDSGMPAHLYDLKENHPSDIVPELLSSRYIAVGSPTLNRQMLPTVAGFLCYLKGLSPGSRDALAFGSFGWDGQSIGLVEKELSGCGFRLLTDSIKVHYRPAPEQLAAIYQQVKDSLSLDRSC